MIRSALLAAAFVCVLSSVAWAAAGDSGNWNAAEPGAANVAKAIDIMAHTTGDGLVRAFVNQVNLVTGTVVTKVYKYNAGTWTLDWTINPGSFANPGNNNANFRLSTSPIAVWPQLVSFNNALYACRLYMACREGPGGSCTNYMYPECRVIKWDGAAETTVLQLGGAASTAWQCGAVFNFYNPTRDSMTPGYLFVSGGTLNWGGGGAKWINPTNTLAGGAAVPDWNQYGMDMKYGYNSADGTTWNLLGGGTGRTLGNDKYGRSLPAAMPDGYRYNHLVSFGGALWDYYGCYDPATLAFTPKTDDIQTEPWGWHLMGQYAKEGSANAPRLARVGFTRKGDQTMLYSITGTTGKWGIIGAEDRVAGEAIVSGGTLAQGAKVIVDDSLQIFGIDPAAGNQAIELPKTAYTCSAAGVVSITPPFAASGFTATYLYTKSTAPAPNNGTVYWRSCAGVANTVKAVAAGDVDPPKQGNGTRRQFQVPQHAHVNITAVQADTAPVDPAKYYTTRSGRIVFLDPADADGKTITATYTYMNPHDGLYCTYSKDNGGGAYESGVYKYNDEDNDWLWTFKQCTSTADARVYTGAIFAKPDDGVYVGKSTGIERRAIDIAAAPPAP